MQSKLKKKSDDQFLDDMKKQFGDGIAIMRSDCILELIADTTGNMGSQVLKDSKLAQTRLKHTESFLRTELET